MGKTRMMLLAVLAFSASSVLAQPIADNDLLTAADPDGIVRYLRQLGYQPSPGTDQTGDPWIRLGLAGMQGSIWFNDCDPAGRNCDSIRMQLGLLTDRKLTAEQVNAFNNRWRFATLSLDEDGDPLLNHDLRLAGSGLPAATVGWTLRQFESVAAELRELVNEQETTPHRTD